MISDIGTIWILARHREGVFDETAFGLLAEARRLAAELGGEARVNAVVAASELEPRNLIPLGRHGAGEILILKSQAFAHYHGELFAEALCELLEKERPPYFFMVESEETADLAPRLAARLNACLVNRIVDLKTSETGELVVTRPVSNGYLFEKVRLEPGARPVILSMEPSVLAADEPDEAKEAAIRTTSWRSRGVPRTRLLEVIEADPESLGVEDAEIVVAGGRGAGKGEAFLIIHELAACLGAAVGGTRPVIDAGILPFERQIGQTGKSVIPRLIVNCGISGANEYTAGMEKSHLAIAVNKDPGARIFQFADLGIVADLREVLPLLIERLREIKE